MAPEKKDNIDLASCRYLYNAPNFPKQHLQTANSESKPMLANITCKRTWRVIWTETFLPIYKDSESVVSMRLFQRNPNGCLRCLVLHYPSEHWILTVHSTNQDVFLMLTSHSTPWVQSQKQHLTQFEFIPLVNLLVILTNCRQSILLVCIEAIPSCHVSAGRLLPIYNASPMLSQAQYMSSRGQGKS